MSNQTYDEIIRKLEKELSRLEEHTLCFIELTEKSIGLCDKVIIQLREMVLTEGFENNDEEIYFFKHIKPWVKSKLIFYTEIFNVEACRPKGDKDEQIEYLKDVIKRTSIYLNENKEFYQYYKRNRTEFDAICFMRGNPDSRIHEDSIHTHLDPEFSTGYDLTLAKIQAYEHLKKFLGIEIGRLKGNVKEEGGLQWTGKKVHAVVLVYALYFYGIINNGQADIIEISRAFEKMFNLDLKNLYNIFNKEIKGRKKDRAEFLQKLLEIFRKRLDEMDE